MARLDEATALAGASFRGAALLWSDYSVTQISQEQVNEAFGDASVRLADSLTRPAHWPRHELGHEFDTEWRKWQANPAAYTPPPPPD